MHNISLLSRLKSTGTVLAAGLILLSGIVTAGEPLVLPKSVDFLIIPPPPEDDSPAGLADLSVLLYVQKERTQEQIDFAKRMEDYSVFAMNRNVFGDWFRRDNLPQTADILRELATLTKPVVVEAKEHWHRPRPFIRSTEVLPVVSKPKDAGSYPSGHSFGMAVPEFVLAAAFPEYSAALDKQTHRVMWGRIVGGAHFPSDTEAGRLLAKHVVDKMLKTDPMKAAIKAIRAEMKPFMDQQAAKLPVVEAPAEAELLPN